MTNNLPALQQICTGLQKMQSSFEQSLPKGLSAEKFIRTATNAIQTHPQLDKLLQADRQSLYTSCQKAAIDGLMLDGREAALICFFDKNAGTSKAQYIPMTQGLVKLARNSGEIANIVAEVVYENDKFVYRIGLDEMPIHEPDWFGDRGKPIGVWAMVKLKSGEIIPRLLPKEKVMKIASKTHNSSQYDPDKGSYFDEWWRKAAIKNVLKYAPKSTELDKVLAEDGEEFNNFQPEPEKPKRQTKAEQVVKQPEPESPSHDGDGIIDAEYEDAAVAAQPETDPVTNTAAEDEEIPV